MTSDAMTFSNASPLVTVIIPIDRMTPYFEGAFSSIVDQTFSDWELIVVANGCSDVDFEAIGRHLASESRASLIRTEIHSVAHAMNLGVHHSRGSLIARMDADDVSLNNRLQVQVDLMKDAALTVVSSSCVIINAAGEVMNRDPLSELSHEEHMSALPLLCCIVSPSSMIRRQCLMDVGGFSFGRYCEDYDLWLRILREIPNAKFLRIATPLIKYRRHATQASSAKNMRAFRAYGFTLKLREFFLTGRPKFLLGAITPARISLRFLVSGKR